ncbi:MAG: XRE family transcriptional regulator [Bacteroidales bacterium]|jgi:DNA invertase Pin-like site-specific DNA recombinase|nr:XRE family transcriptional regulator [Bacteroidales bacterium]
MENKIHIGSLIKQELKIQGKSITWLINTTKISRSTILRIFDSPTIDTGILKKISDVLDHDFFVYYRKKN